MATILPLHTHEILICGHEISITCARNYYYYYYYYYQLIILMSFLDSWVSKSSAPSLETATAYVMTLRFLLCSRQCPISGQNLVCIDLQVVAALTELLRVSVVFSGHLSFNTIVGT